VLEIATRVKEIPVPSVEVAHDTQLLVEYRTRESESPMMQWLAESFIATLTAGSVRLGEGVVVSVPHEL
jgi:hypothetical protein